MKITKLDVSIRSSQFTKVTSLEVDQLCENHLPEKVIGQMTGLWLFNIEQANFIVAISYVEGERNCAIFVNAEMLTQVNAYLDLIGFGMPTEKGVRIITKV